MVKTIFSIFYQKKKFLHEITLRNQLRMIFTDFLHMFTFLKLEIRLRKKFFGKSYFFPKILNFCHVCLLLVKPFWMIVSPQKRVKKKPYNLYLPNTPILSKLVKNEFSGHFQNSLQVRKNFKNYYGSIES